MVGVGWGGDGGCSLHRDQKWQGHKESCLGSLALLLTKQLL
jgi:hypothetical protein